MYRNSVLIKLAKTLAVCLLLISGVASAASQDLESGRWHLLSMPGDSTDPVSSLFGNTLSADTINDNWSVFTYNSASGAYKQLSPEDRIADSEAFWFIQITGQPVSVDLALVVNPPSLRRSAACVSARGCVEHELTASGADRWTLVGAPFTQSIPVNQLRLVTTSEVCAQGCTIESATEAGLSSGIFYGYDAAARRYNSISTGASLQPGSGYWFDTTLPADIIGAKLLIPSPASEPTDANLLFRSGFESGTTLSSVLYGYQRLNGTDSVSGYRWDESLNGLWGSSNNGIHLINGGGMSGGIRNELQSIMGHSGGETMALYQDVAFSSGSPIAQTPYQINNISEDPDEYYISYWMKLDDTSLDIPNQWRLLWQFKSDRFHYQHPEPGYRIGVYLYTDENGAYWHVKGDDGPQNRDYWSVSDRDTPVPRDEWFQIEIYNKVSAGDDGRFWAKINGSEIASHNGPSLGSEADTMWFMMLWQLYGNSYPGHQWIDDIEIWDGVPY